MGINIVGRMAAGTGSRRKQTLAEYGFAVNRHRVVVKDIMLAYIFVSFDHLRILCMAFSAGAGDIHYI